MPQTRNPTRLEKIAAHVPGVIYQYRQWPDGRTAFPYASPGILHIYGVRPEQVQTDATEVFKMLHPDDLERVSRSIAVSERDLTPWHDVYRVNLPDGRLLWVEGEASPERLPDQSTVWHGYIRDITERKRVDAELAAYRSNLERLIEERTAELASARDEALRANSEKSNFLANMSHEIRTPLNSIIGFGDLLLSESVGPLNDEQRHQLQILSRASRHLLALISDILDMSKIEAGQLKVEHQPFDLGDVIARCADTLGGSSQAKGVPLIVRVEGGGLWAMGDERRTFQVLVNLVSNALKFTEHGQIEINARREGTEAVVEVIDTGAGISDADQGSLFQPFRQGSQQHRQRVDGVGLGLAISKRLVELQGGRIWARSVTGVGSTFGFAIQARSD